MDSYPSVTVVMPAYQAERTIGGAISSVLTQAYPGRVDIVVVDDGSTDASAAVARSHGDRVSVVVQENAGTAAARNVALSRAEGDLVALCDADDILLPPYLRSAVDTWHRAGSGRRFVTCNALLMTENGIGHGRTVMNLPVPPPRRQRLGILEANFVSGFAVMPAAMLRELGGWTVGCYVEDWELWVRAIYAGWEVIPATAPHALPLVGREQVDEHGRRLRRRGRPVTRRARGTDGRAPRGAGLPAAPPRRPVSPPPGARGGTGPAIR